MRINGSVHHMIGPLHPGDGELPRFAQLYVYDNDNELENRLQSMLHQENYFVRTFKAATSQPMLDGKIDFHCDSGLDRWRYNVPTSAEVAGVLLGDANVHARDIVVQFMDDRPCWRINNCHPAYQPLQFVLLLPH